MPALGFILLLCLTPALCLAASARSIILPSGDKGFSIQCDNESKNKCYEKAGEICHRGYDIQIENKDSGMEGSSGSSANAYFGTSSSTVKTTSEKGMIISCKEPELTEAERVAAQRQAEKEQEDNEREYAAESAKNNWKVLLFAGGLVAITLSYVAYSNFTR